MNRRVTDIDKETIKNYNQTISSKSYRRTSVPNATQQSIVRKQELMNTQTKVQPLKRLERHGKNDTRKLQYIHTTSKQDIQQQHQSQNIAVKQHIIQNKNLGQEKQGQTKANIYNRKNQQGQNGFRNQDKLQSSRSSKALPPSSFLYPNRGQYKINKNQKSLQNQDNSSRKSLKINAQENQHSQKKNQALKDSKRQIQELKEHKKPVKADYQRASYPLKNQYPKMIINSQQQIQQKASLYQTPAYVRPYARNNTSISVIKKEDQEAKSQLIHSKIKIKSNLLVFSLAKIRKACIQQSWYKLKQYAILWDRKFKIYGRLLTQSANLISQEYLNALKQHFFKQMKISTIKRFKATQKITQQLLYKHELKQKNLMCWFIQALFKDRLRNAYHKLNNNRNKLDLICQGVVCLGVIGRKKQKNYKRDFFNNLASKASIKNNKISEMILLLQNFFHQRKKNAFSKLIKYNLPKINKKPSIKKLLHRNSNINQRGSQKNIHADVNAQTIENLKRNIEDKKKSFFSDKISYQNSIRGQKSIITQNQAQISEMGIRNQQLKRKLQVISKKEKQEISKESIEHEEKQILYKLMKIYKNVLKMDDNTQIQVKDIIKQYRLPTLNIVSDPSIYNWQLIIQHTNLKRLIENIEGINPKEVKAVAVLQEEQKIITKLIRSHIKERYLWEWVRDTLHA